MKNLNAIFVSLACCSLALTLFSCGSEETARLDQFLGVWKLESECKGQLSGTPMRQQFTTTTETITVSKNEESNGVWFDAPVCSVIAQNSKVSFYLWYDESSKSYFLKVQNGIFKDDTVIPLTYSEGSGFSQTQKPYFRMEYTGVIKGFDSTIEASIKWEDDKSVWTISSLWAGGPTQHRLELAP